MAKKLLLFYEEPAIDNGTTGRPRQVASVLVTFESDEELGGRAIETMIRALTGRWDPTQEKTFNCIYTRVLDDATPRPPLN